VLNDYSYEAPSTHVMHILDNSVETLHRALHEVRLKIQQLQSCLETCHSELDSVWHERDKLKSDNLRLEAALSSISPEEVKRLRGEDCKNQVILENAV